MRAVGLVGGLGFMLGGMAVLGALLGNYLDRRWGTGPWLTLAGTLLGTGAGFREIVVVMRRVGANGNRTG
jgi:F0F1-type ATP synthase assembly protein I